MNTSRTSPGVGTVRIGEMTVLKDLTPLLCTFFGTGAINFGCLQVIFAGGGGRDTGECRVAVLTC